MSFFEAVRERERLRAAAELPVDRPSALSPSERRDRYPVQNPGIVPPAAEVNAEPPELEEARDTAARRDIASFMRLVAWRPVLLDHPEIRTVWRERVQALQNDVVSYEQRYRPYERQERPRDDTLPRPSPSEIRAAREAARKARVELRRLFVPSIRATPSMREERRICEHVMAAHRALSDFFARLNRDPRARSFRRWFGLSPKQRLAVFQAPIDSLERWQREARALVADSTLKSDFRGALVDLFDAVTLPPTRRVDRDPFYNMISEAHWDRHAKSPSELAWQASAYLLGTSESTLRRRIRRAGVPARPTSPIPDWTTSHT